MTSSPNSDDRRRVLLAFLSIYVFWGSSFVVMRIGVQNLPPLLFGGVRFVIAGVIMLLIARLYGNRVQPQRHEWRHLAVLACFGFLLSNGLSVWAMQYVSSNQAALLNASVPCWIVLLGAFGSRAHQPAPRALTGVVLGVIGTILVIGRGAGSSGPLGAQLVLMASYFAWAVSTVYLRNSGTVMPVLTLIGWQMLLGGISLSLAGVLIGELPRWQWNMPGMLSLAALIVFASCIGHTAHAWLATRTTPAKLSTYGYVNPAVAALMGWLVLGETLGGLQLLGMAVVLGGVLMINWPRATRTDVQ